MMFMEIVLPIAMFDVLEPLQEYGVFSIESIVPLDLETREDQKKEILNQMQDLGY